jgi:hypothetical protein
MAHDSLRVDEAVAGLIARQLNHGVEDLFCDGFVGLRLGRRSNLADNQRQHQPNEYMGQSLSDCRYNFIT